MRSYEFYTTPKGEVDYITDNVRKELTQNSSDVIEDVNYIFSSFYPEAFKAASDVYKASDKNTTYYRFLIARRLIKCNFGQYDNVIDVDFNGKLSFEFVSCPMRGECKYEGIICSPRFNSSLTQRELDVMKMCVEGKSDDDIASTLFISLNTVNNHRKNSFKKLDVHSMPEFMRYANNNKLFNN